MECSSFVLEMQDKDNYAGHVHIIYDACLKCKIHAATSVSILQEIHSAEAGLICDTGCNKQLTNVDIYDKTDIIQALKSVLHVYIYSKAETDQFIEGLEKVGIFDALKKYSSEQYHKNIRHSGATIKCQ